MIQKWNPHDLIKIKNGGTGCFDREIPFWAENFLKDTPWVVVRRGTADEGIPVGIRGFNKNQKFACLLKEEATVQKLSPGNVLDLFIQEVYDHRLLQSPRLNEQMIKDVQLVERIRNEFCGGHRGNYIQDMGIGGSLGFEIASGKKVSTAASDLDIIITLNDRQRQYTGDKENDTANLYVICKHLLNELGKLQTRADAVLKTREGWIALEEYVRSPRCFLIKAPDGSCRLGKELHP